MQTKTFPVRVILTSTTGRLLTKGKGDRDNGIGDLYEFLAWMTDDSPFTHQLGRFSEECNPWLFRWFPELEKVNEHLATLDEYLSVSDDKARTIHNWLDMVVQVCGFKTEYDVPKIPRDDHTFKDPVEELIVMRGTDEGIVVIEPLDD